MKTKAFTSAIQKLNEIYNNQYEIIEFQMEGPYDATFLILTNSGHILYDLQLDKYAIAKGDEPHEGYLTSFEYPIKLPIKALYSFKIIF